MKKLLNTDGNIIAIEQYNEENVELFWNKESLGIYNIYDLKNLLRIRKTKKGSICLNCGGYTDFNKTFCCTECREQYFGSDKNDKDTMEN
jgi:hypothetical protein